MRVVVVLGVLVAALVVLVLLFDVVSLSELGKAREEITEERELKRAPPALLPSPSDDPPLMPESSSPSPSALAFGKTGFEEAMERYIQMHADSLRGVVQPRYLIWVCRGYCPGWGDRVRGMLTVMTLGVLTNRTVLFSMDGKDMPLTDIYQADPIDWNRNVDEGGMIQMDCLHASNPCACLQDNGIISALREEKGIVVNTNGWCWDHFASHPDLASERERLGIDGTRFWRSILFKKFLPPTLKLTESLSHYLPKSGPSRAVHIRTGVISSENGPRFPAEKDQHIENVLHCLNESLSALPEKAEVPTFLAVDNENIIPFLLVKSEDYFGTRKVEFITGEALGTIEHVTFHTGPFDQFAWRMHVEWEILRRVDGLVVANSGFSYMAHCLRERYESFDTDPTRNCARMYSKEGVTGSEE